MRKILLFKLICTIFFVVVFSNLLFSEEFKPYQSLIQKESSEPFGHLIVQVPKERVLPDNWERQWFVSTYTPKGYRLPLGVIQDKKGFLKESRLIFKVPIGKLKIEITRRKNDLNRVVFNMDEGIHQFSSPKALYVSDIAVKIREDDIKMININYENPKCLKSEDKEKNVKRFVYLWENFNLTIQDGSSADLIESAPDIYPIINIAPFQDIDENHLVEALKKDHNWIVVNSFLYMDKINTDLIIAALKDKSLKFNYSVAQVLAKSGDKNAIIPLIDILNKGQDEFLYGVAWTLGELKAKEAVPVLVNGLKHKSLIMRNHSAFALGKIEDTRAVLPLIQATESKACLKGMQFVLKNPELLITIFMNKQYKTVGLELPIPSYCVSDNAIFALGRIGNEDALIKLISLLDHPDSSIQRKAIYGLANIRDERVRDALIQKLKSKDQSVRFLSIQVLGNFIDEGALNALEERHKIESDKMVLEALDTAIKKIKEPVKKPPKPDLTDEQSQPNMGESKGNKFLIIFVSIGLLIIVMVLIGLKAKKKSS